MNLDPFYDELEETLKEEIPSSLIGGKALDVGCGRGWLTRLFYDEWNLNVIGIDKSIENIKTCRSFAQNLPILYEERDMKDLDFDSYLNSFSIISCHNVLGYLPSPQEQIQKIWSWLHPNGMLSLVTRSPSGWFAEVYERSKSVDLALQRYQEMKMNGSFGESCDFFLLKDLVNMIESVGFSVLRIKGFYSLTRNLPAGYKALQEKVTQTEREEHFFQWVLCTRKN